MPFPITQFNDCIADVILLYTYIYMCVCVHVYLSCPSQTESCPVPEFPQIKAYNRKKGGGKTRNRHLHSQKSNNLY